MQVVEPSIIYDEKFGKTGLYKSIVEYPNLDRELYPYPLKSQFITKKLKLTSKSEFPIRINPILCEAFINKNFKSPYLNLAEYVTIQNGIIVLFFNEANGDFHRFGRNNFETIKGWIKSIVKGIVHLHLHRFLHGDIKASNVLIFDGIAKLSDFGSSSLIIGDGCQKFHTKLYTPTHRPPEVWINDQFDLSADIWALGCTIYEMIYGEPLFQIKNTNEEYISQIETWCSNTPNLTYNFEFSKRWNQPIYNKVNKLILKMLNPNPFERPTIFEVINDEFFQNEITLSSSPPMETNCNYGSLSTCPIIAQRVFRKTRFFPGSKGESIYKKLKLFESDDEIRMLVMCMYETYSDTIEYSPELLKTLLLIAHLITHREKPETFTISRADIDNILIYSSTIGFNYVNWGKFYGVYEKFNY